MATFTVNFWWETHQIFSPIPQWRHFLTDYWHLNDYSWSSWKHKFSLSERVDKVTVWPMNLVGILHFGWCFFIWPSRVQPKWPRHAAPSPGQSSEYGCPRGWNLEVVLPSIRIAHTQAHLAEKWRTNPSPGETRRTQKGSVFTFSRAKALFCTSRSVRSGWYFYLTVSFQPTFW